MVHEPRRGYGNAYLAGLAAAKGRYIVMLDADLTYDIGELPRFVAALEEGGDLVSATACRGSTRARCPGCTATSATRC